MTPIQRKIAEMCKQVPTTGPQVSHGAATPTGGRFALIKDQIKQATASTFQLPQMAAPTTMPKMVGVNRGVGTTSSPALPTVKDSPTSPKLAANYRDIQNQIRMQGIPRSQAPATFGPQPGLHSAPPPKLRGPEQTFDWGAPEGPPLELAPHHDQVSKFQQFVGSKTPPSPQLQAFRNKVTGG